MDKGRAKGVTKTLSAPKSREKRYAPDGPRRQAERLALWLAIANGTAKAPLKFDEIVFDLSPIFFEPLRRSVRASFERIVVFADVLRTRDPGLLERYRRAGAKQAGTLPLVWEAEGGEFWGDLALGLDGRLRNNAGNPRALFINALRGAELLRFNRCPICERFFYAIRADQIETISRGVRSTATNTCSKRCRDTLRSRRWRHKEDERIATAGAMSRKGKRIQEIARALEVTNLRARRYVSASRSKKEHNR